MVGLGGSADAGAGKAVAEATTAISATAQRRIEVKDGKDRGTTNASESFGNLPVEFS
jgi:hypothetical protein